MLKRRPRSFPSPSSLPLVVAAWLLSLTSANVGAAPDMQVNGCVAVVSKDFTRWSEGGFLVLDENNILLAVTGYTGWNHDHSPANIYAFRSHDGGRSWTPQEKAILIQEAAEIGMVNVMSVSLLKLHNGNVLMTFFAYGEAGRRGGMFVKRSTDHAQTWSKARCVDPESIPMPGRSFQLPTGRIVVPISGGVEYSDDDGRSWHRSLCPQTGGNETSVVPLKDGRLLLFMRNSTGQILKSYSDDDGTTWGPMQPTGIPSPASMNTLARLQNGELLLVFNMVRDRSEISGPWPRHRLCTMVSRDEGQTWRHLRFLDGGDQFANVYKITMASVATVGKDGVIVAWSRSPQQSKEHYRNLYDYRIRKFNLDWLYAGNDPTTYKAPD